MWECPIVAGWLTQMFHLTWKNWSFDFFRSLLRVKTLETIPLHLEVPMKGPEHQKIAEAQAMDANILCSLRKGLFVQIRCAHGLSCGAHVKIRATRCNTLSSGQNGSLFGPQIYHSWQQLGRPWDRSWADLLLAHRGSFPDASRHLQDELTAEVLRPAITRVRYRLLVARLSQKPCSQWSNMVLLGH